MKVEINVFFISVKPPWRNGLACWTSNSKVVGSSPTGGGIFSFLGNTQSLFQTVESSVSLAKCRCVSKAIDWNCETRKIISIPFAPVRCRSFWIRCINGKNTVESFHSTGKLTVLKF